MGADCPAINFLSAGGLIPHDYASRERHALHIPGDAIKACVVHAAGAKFKVTDFAQTRDQVKHGVHFRFMAALVILHNNMMGDNLVISVFQDAGQDVGGINPTRKHNKRFILH